METDKKVSDIFMNMPWITNILFPEVVKLLTGEGELHGTEYSHELTYVKAKGNITKSSGLFTWLKLSGYAKYILEFISQLHLANNITFLGPMNAKEMKA